jgi:hypothetical protein
MAVPDFSDPCARFAYLRDAYYQLIAGANESLIRFRGPEGEQEVRFSAGNIETLKVEVDAAEHACAVAQGRADPNRRYAIRAGAKRQTRVADFWSVPSWWFAP